MVLGPSGRGLLPVCCPPSKAKLRSRDVLEQARHEALMGIQATAYLRGPAADPVPLVSMLRPVGVPPASPLGRVRTLDEGMPWNWVTPAQRGGRSWAARLMRLRRHSPHFGSRVYRTHRFPMQA
jgi:hypothetical protein